MAKKNGLNKILFKIDPFYLYPLKDDLLKPLFIDREDEINVAKGILMDQLESSLEICAVVGGIGIGKSSILNYIGGLAESNGFSVKHLAGTEAYQNEVNGLKIKKELLLIDDIDKADDEQAIEFYTELGKTPTKGRLIFFTDTYDRSSPAISLRGFTISHNISLPQGLTKEQLRFFLEERMRNCLTKDSTLIFPFTNEAIEMAAIRSQGNLRAFLNCVKHGWKVARGGNLDEVGTSELEKGISAIDRVVLGACDIRDSRLRWFATVGDMNKAFLAHQAGVDSKTLESRIRSRLHDFIKERKDGKDIFISSIYKEVPGGKEILESIIKSLGFPMPVITGNKRNGKP